jgi:hypothetical protein
MLALALPVTAIIAQFEFEPICKYPSNNFYQSSDIGIDIGIDDVPAHFPLALLASHLYDD